VCTNLKKSELLKKDTKKLLNSKQILQEVGKFGNVHLTGSYALDLMVWRDIDLLLEVDTNLKDRVRVFSDIAYKFLHDSDLKNIKLINFTPGKKVGMPTGMYMGLTCNYNQENWKIDIWALDSEPMNENIEFMNQVKSKLTKDLKKLIIDWKYKLLRDGRVPQLGSYMLYKAILFEGIRREEEIFRYLQENGVKI
jgi:hypothetical protein